MYIIILDCFIWFNFKNLLEFDSILDKNHYRNNLSDIDQQQLQEIFDDEVDALKNLEHPNILKLLKHSNKGVAKRSDGSQLDVNYMCIEYAEGGELFEYISETGAFTENEVRYFFRQIINALEYMHDKGYAHRDLKPENILFDEEFNVKIADFGFATKQAI